ncbi:MAG: LicD family protein [Jaaginema sp. PMC 1079.18]|nr:LicD family protein [Jaaginema sp. PMC 1080.18]MEC4851382.1 LicD family protein [Jaaginema sp. PMC 1079.18]MEC4866423.1 LicD family protein [Jaaginema sp. PMC 1078.18]
MLYKSWHTLKRNWRLMVRHSKYYRPFKADRNQAVIHQKLKTIFQVTNQFLSQLNVEYWIAYGTLLGYYREQNLIPGDGDVDFGLSEQYYQTIWQARNQLPQGFQMYDTSCYHFGPKLYITHDGWEADLYFYQDRGNQLQSYENAKICYRKSFPKTYIYPLQQANFLEEVTWIPQQTEALLTHTYRYLGKDAVRDSQTGYWYQK